MTGSCAIDNRLLQLERVSTRMPACGTVRVCQARNGTLTIRYRDRALPWRELVPGHSRGADVTVGEVDRQESPADRGCAVHERCADHPWRQGYGTMRGGSASVWQAIRE